MQTGTNPSQPDVRTLIIGSDDGAFFAIVLLTLVLMTLAMISALTAMQFAIHGREVAIPKLVGMAPLEAERAASASGLQLAVERQFYSADIPEGRIMTQMPPPGAKVRRGWTVRVAQSLGPQRIAIPDVTSGSQRAAELNIRRRGLAVGFVAQVNLPDVPPDQVASQSPSRQCQRRFSTEDRFVGQPWRRTSRLRDAKPYWPAARERDACVAGCRHADRQSQRVMQQKHRAIRKPCPVQLPNPMPPA